MQTEICVVLSAVFVAPCRAKQPAEIAGGGGGGAHVTHSWVGCEQHPLRPLCFIIASATLCC